MKRVFKAFKVAFVYVGTMVGAGYATGQEIKLYFANTNIFTIILSSLTTACFCILLLNAGRLNCVNKSILKVLTVLFGFSALVIAGIMLSGIKAITNSSLAVVPSLLFCVMIAFWGNKGMKIFNFVAVPLIVVAVIVVAFTNNGWVMGSTRVVGAIGYAAMNIFFESILMYQEGKSLDKKEILLSGFIVFAVMFVLIYCMVKSINNQNALMPFLAVTKQIGCYWLGIVVVLLAIYSTVINCLNVGITFFLKFTNKYIAISYVFVVSLLLSLLPFEVMINNVYPIFSYFGIALSIIILICMIAKTLKDLIGKTKLPHIKARVIMNKIDKISN